MDPKQLSILHLTPFYKPNVGGVETHLVDLMRYLRPQVKQLSVITYQALVGKSRGLGLEKDGNLTVRRIKWPTNLYYATLKSPILNFIYLFPGIFGYALWWKFLKQPEVDIIHAHGINAGLGGVILKYLWRRPLIISMHVEFHFQKGSLISLIYIWVLKRADLVLVLTAAGKRELIRFGLDDDQVAVYSYWVDQKKFRPVRGAKQRLKWELKKPVVLFVGRLTPEKGVNVLIETARKLPGVQFVVAGNGQLESVVTQVAKELKNLDYVGLIDNASLPLYYNAAELLVVPSLVRRTRPIFEEGVPRVIIEAISSGTPVIGTDNGGIKEVIENGRVGQVVESNSESLIRSINQLLDSPKELAHLSSRCRQYAKRRFGEQSAKLFIKSYQKVCQAA